MDYFEKKEEVRKKIVKLRQSMTNRKNKRIQGQVRRHKCPNCGQLTEEMEFLKNLRVCPNCGCHTELSAKDRLEYVMDDFVSIGFQSESPNPLNFPGYEEKRNLARDQTQLEEAVIVGKGKIMGYSSYIFAMDSKFLMASMGIEVGRRISTCFEMAREEGLPVIGFCASGGARMQEGIFSLMQMASTTFALRKHSESGNLFISVLTDPTTGGVSASFANLADIIIAEPEARICFTGRRVIEQTIHEKLPKEFQKAEFLFEHGFIDDIVLRKDQKSYLSLLLSYHRRKNEN